jgi:beta-lactamase class A
VRARLVTGAVVVSLLAACGGPDAAGPPGEVKAPTPSTTVSPAPSEPAAPAEQPLDLAGLEAELDVRVGVYALDTGTGQVLVHRADERFAYASTFKVLAAAAVMAEADDAELATLVPYGPQDLQAHAPVAEANLATGLTLRELAAAAVTTSDNTAGNLLLERLGGPTGFAERLRAVGDDVTSPARTEPELNTAVPGDDRDTSTPRQLAATLRTYLLGDVLDPRDRAEVEGWMLASTTGTGLIRAGVPADWVVAGKSGAGSYGTRNDIAVVRPPGRDPLVVAVLTSRDGEDDQRLDVAVARAAEQVVAALGG